MGILNWIVKAFSNQPLMWLILVISVVAIFVTLRKLIFIMITRKVLKSDFLARVNQQLLLSNVDRAIATCSESKNPLSVILKAGLVALNNGKSNNEIQSTMNTITLSEINLIQQQQKNVAYLSILILFLGILAGFSGFAGAYANAANLKVVEKLVLYSDSIPIALSCTCFSLMVSIPLLSVYAILYTTSKEMADWIQASAANTLTFIIRNRDLLKK